MNGIYIALLILQIMTIAFMYIAYKHKINKVIYGIRYRPYYEFDTGRFGWCLLSKNLDSTKIDGQTRSVNLQNAVGGTLVFSEDIAENLKCEYSNEKALFYQNSNEFDTLMQNRVLEQLMYIQSKNLIVIMLVVCVLTLVVSGYTLYEERSLKASMEVMMNTISQYQNNAVEVIQNGK